jgi:hypothetical protein
MAQITRIVGDFAENLFVPGVDPEAILHAARGALDDDDEVILTPVRGIEVRWFRVNPCHPNSCWDGGIHNGHWTPTDGKTRGGFQGAMLATGYRDHLDGVHR